MKRGIVILALLILAMFSMSYVCAGDADDVTDDEIEIADYENNIELAGEDLACSNDDNLAAGDGTFSQLQGEIDDASILLPITLQKDYYYNDDFENGKDGIVISKQITINGNGHVIDGLGKSKLFVLKSNNLLPIGVTFNNVTFRNGEASANAGGVDVLDGAKVTFKATIKYTGNKYYKVASKKVKIKIK